MIVKINLIPVTFQMINSGDPCYIASIKFKNLKKILAFLNIVCCVLLHYILCQCLNVTLFDCMTKPSRIFSPLEQLWHLKSGKWVKSLEFWNCNFDYVINANFMGLTIQRTFLHSILPQKGSVWLVHLELHPCESSICYWSLEESSRHIALVVEDSLLQATDFCWLIWQFLLVFLWIYLIMHNLKLTWSPKLSCISLMADISICQAIDMKLIKLVGLWNKDLIFSFWITQQIKNQLKMEDGLCFYSILWEHKWTLSSLTEACWDSQSFILGNSRYKDVVMAGSISIISWFDCALNVVESNHL